ncbi:hypothetical protein HRG_012119 [Hirsutella rhossiliensis]
MSIQDTILAIYSAEDDCLYRILREDDVHGKRAVYVLLEYPDLIPKDSRTYGPTAIRELSKLTEWYGEWKTLTISIDESGLRRQPDAFKPHALSQEYVYDGYGLFDIFKLKDLEGVKTRTWRFREQEKPCYLKMARFDFEIEALEREAKAYQTLTYYGSTLAPKLLGYAYEETHDRVIGLIIEEVIGRHPTIADLAICREGLRQLHGFGIIHGDVNMYNIFITKDGAKFIDFEESCIGTADQEEAWVRRANKEMQSLEEKLLDKSGEGRPWE